MLGPKIRVLGSLDECDNLRATVSISQFLCETSALHHSPLAIKTVFWSIV